MTEPNTTAGELTPASPTPVAPSVDVEALISRMNAESDKRFSGMMSMFDKKLNEVRTEVRRGSRAVVDDDGDDPRVRELQDELDRVRREAEMERAGREYPDAFPLYRQILEQPDADAQLRALDAAIKAARTPPPAPEPTPEPEPEPEAPPEPRVDPNNPPRRATQGGVLYNIAGKDVVVDENFATRHLGFNPFKR